MKQQRLPNIVTRTLREWGIRDKHFPNWLTFRVSSFGPNGNLVNVGKRWVYVLRQVKGSKIEFMVSSEGELRVYNNSDIEYTKLMPPGTDVATAVLVAERMARMLELPKSNSERGY